ncbi:MIT domain-containing protein 1-like protein [Aphelenchoides avenae]|nr:MIT domain-containing protein 1-like protein [Aphelenchus avenae]
MRQGSSATFEELLSKAKPLLEKAVRNDKNENKLEAVRCYVEGIELLLNAIEIAPEGSKEALRKRAQDYTKRCEDLKSHRGAKITDYRSYDIKEDSVGHSYETIFSMCINDEVTEVAVEDPYIITAHQSRKPRRDECIKTLPVTNFLMFCELLVRKARNVQTVTLMTQKKREQNAEQQAALDELTESLKRKNVKLCIDYRDFHDRYVRFNNGYEVKMGRGLDIYKPLKRFDIGKHDYLLRPCRETTFQIFKKVA